MARKFRRGFTVIELLAVTAIIGVLLALTVPAVMYARETARKAQCQNNLAQIGRALHNHHSMHARFPEAVPPAGTGSNGVEALISPQVALLPFIEQGGLFGRIDRVRGPGYAAGPPYSPDAATVLPVYICPSDPVGGGNSYRGCSGPDPYAVPTAWVETGESGRGSFVVTQRVAAGDITDGLSNTVGFGEKRKSAGDGGSFAPGQDAWYTGAANLGGYPSTREVVSLCGSLSGEPATYQANVGATWMYVGYHYSLYNHTVAPNAKLADCDIGDKVPSPPPGGVYKASSYHRGGVNALMMDGAVRFVADGIDLGVWRGAATRAGGEPGGF